jgi:hypothetical protein
MKKDGRYGARFLGTYFDRDQVIRFSNTAGALAWLALAFFLAGTVISFTQFMIQFVGGWFFQKGMTILDLIGFFTPFLGQIAPGLGYFGGLKFIQYTLLILLEVEENTRRSAAGG